MLHAANILVRYLGEEGSKTPVAAAISMCNPFNLVSLISCAPLPSLELTFSQVRMHVRFGLPEIARPQPVPLWPSSRADGFNALQSGGVDASLLGESRRCPKLTPCERRLKIDGLIVECLVCRQVTCDENFKIGFNRIYDKNLANGLRRIYKSHEHLFQGLKVSRELFHVFKVNLPLLRSCELI